ncbi:MAG: isopenicillin N synthase family oxygenase [Myxococcales bacterium]|nr:isopenicillin N synthase family oxygenase [Myxococcales bacterium]
MATQHDQTIPVVDLADWNAGGAAHRRFVEGVGAALADIGFFAVANHGIPEALTRGAYDAARRLFGLPAERKARYHRAGAKGQRGFTGFGTEHAKDSGAPDLKEFWQVGRPDVPDDHPVHAPFGPNVWPDDDVPEFRATLVELYRGLDRLGGALLEACAEYVGEPAGTFRDMATDSDTIVRVIYYPPVGADAPPGSVRSAAHEDINLITLLSGATAEGLELLQRDGTWRPVHTAFDTIVVDAGDMLQNVTNGLYRSTTHRVVNPVDAGSDRYSMPCFIHPRKEVDLTPLPSCVARTGGAPTYPSITAGAYLEQRLREIGLG